MGKTKTVERRKGEEDIELRTGLPLGSPDGVVREQAGHQASAALSGGEALGILDAYHLADGVSDLLRSGNAAQESLRFFGELVNIALGSSEVRPAKRDQRFADATWTDNPFYRRLGQSYLAWSQTVDRMIDGMAGDWQRKERARFTSELLVSTLSPTNTLVGNPAALKRSLETGGISLLRGARNFLKDVATNGGMPTQVDTRPFKVGENVAVTPGAVIYREEIFELIQYTPTTPTVRSRPLLMVPPQINKYYFLDLAPGRSLTEYAVGQGIQYFTIVWRDPKPQHGHWGLEDYIAAQQKAVEVVRDVTGSKDVNLLGVCAGGLTAAIMQGLLATIKDRSVNSASYFVTMLSSDQPNLLRVLANDRTLGMTRKLAESDGIIDRASIARNFAWLRPDDLVWNYVVNNWLLGNDPPAFDILAWNHDSTGVTARFDAKMLEIYQESLLARPGALEILGTPIDLSKVTSDTFIVAGMTDHITPWKPCYTTAKLLGGRSEIVITSTGHIQSIVNPPDKARGTYFADAEPVDDPDLWLRRAKQHQGSWWPRWTDWLAARSGEEVSAPEELGNDNYLPGDPAPGLYVRGG